LGAKDRLKTAQLAKTIIILEDIDFTWTAEQIALFREMWQAGVSLSDMAEKFDRDVDEVVLLAMHEARQKRIFPRAGGWKGHRPHA